MNLCMYVHIYNYIYIYMHIYIHKYIIIYIYIHIYMYIKIYIYMKNKNISIFWYSFDEYIYIFHTYSPANNIKYHLFKKKLQL